MFRSRVAAFVLGVLLPLTANGATISGIVQSVDTHSFVLSVDQKDGSKEVRQLEVFPDTIQNRGGMDTGSPLPPCVRVGNRITVTGSLDQEGKVLNNAIITGPRGRGRGRHDPTGVRARLRRCLSRHQNHD